MVRRTLLPGAIAVALSLCSGPSGAVDKAGYNAFYDSAARPFAKSAQAGKTGLTATSFDHQRGLPALSFAAARPAPPAHVTTAAAAAHYFLEQHALDSAAMDTARVLKTHDTGRGPIVVTFRQRIGDVDVFHSDAKVLLARDLSLVAIAGSLRDDASVSAAFSLDGARAIESAFRDLHGLAIADEVVDEGALAGDFRAFSLRDDGAARAADLVFSENARAKRVWFPLPHRLVAAYYLEMFVGRVDATNADAYAYVIAADDGRLLYRQNLTVNDAFDYRVFADTDGDHRPLDGPIADHTPHPTGVPDQSYPAYVAPVLISMEGFNTNPEQAADPWLPANATESQGNNVHAYTDDSAPDGFSSGDVRATTTSSQTFDRVFDTSADPTADDDQRAAAVTQLFYTINWLHDYWYDSGFDEQAGNAQFNNYGRGGLPNDAMRAEGQDGVQLGQLNNANMATPTDGFSPRMQMYVYSAPAMSDLDVQPLNMSLVTSSASFGPGAFDVTAELALAEDGTPDINDICQSVTNDVSGKIALIDRGTCTFSSKVQRAEAAGAVGVIIANHTAGAPPPQMPGQGNTGIGVVSVTFEDGNLLKSELMNGTVTVDIARTIGVRSDSTLDTLIIAHEWGHYLHHRLQICSARQCAGQSEGWGDFLSLHTAIREGDDVIDGTYSAAVFAPVARFDAGYFGIRRAPYSRDISKSPLTFRHIQDGEPLPGGAALQGTSPRNSEVHNTGEVWAAMMLEAYGQLIDRTTGANPAYSFDEARRRISEYIVAGLQLAPRDPTFTEQRDALLAVAAANDPDDMLALAAGFAARGAGSCAVAPPRDSFDNIGVVENYDVAPTMTVTSVSLDETGGCDEDGQLDAGESGVVTIEVANLSPLALSAGSITLSTPTPGVSLDSETVLTVAALEPYGSTALTADVSLAAGSSDIVPFELDVDVSAPEACNPNYVVEQSFRLNYDNVEVASSSEGFDSTIDVWTPEGSEPDVVWSREEFMPLDGVYRAIDLGRISDTWLLSPELDVSASEPLILTLTHRHSFEVDPDTFWDAGVIEITADGGMTWTDVVMYDDPGYDGPVSNLADNPLSDRQAFVAENPSWPATDTVAIDLGESFAGETVQFRFRVGTDQAASDFGWEIHNTVFDGIENTPFPSIVDDTAACMAPPIADAGADQTVASGALVQLDGSASTDPDGDAITLAWQGPITLSAADSETPTFTAPSVSEDTTIEITLTVDDGTATDSDSVTITVQAADVVDPSEGGEPLRISGGCGCTIPTSNWPRRDSPGRDTPWHAGWLLALGSIALVTRRRSA